VPVATDPDALVPQAYRDASRRWVTVSPAARSAALAAIGPPIEFDPVAIVRPGAQLPAPGDVTLEDGTHLGRLDALPRDVPHGYHRLEGDDGAARTLLCGPGVCHLPPDLRAWGWVVQLPSTRSRASWGIGDLRDLRRLGEWAGSVGAGFVVTGPLVAPQPGPDPDASPYFPSPRR
jgi:4-alpha-glucanotransferase